MLRNNRIFGILASVIVLALFAGYSSGTDLDAEVAKKFDEQAAIAEQLEKVAVELKKTIIEHNRNPSPNKLQKIKYLLRRTVDLADKSDALLDEYLELGDNKYIE